MPNQLIDNQVVRTGLYTRPTYTVTTLPAAANNQGCEAFVTDANASPDTNYGQVAAGSGTFQARVVSDGTAWRLSRGLQD